MAKGSTVESHITNTQALITAAEKFVSNPNVDKSLAASAKTFISSAENHIASAEKMVTSSEQHVQQLSSLMGSAEHLVSGVSGFFGPKSKASKPAVKAKPAAAKKAK